MAELMRANAQIRSRSGLGGGQETIEVRRSILDVVGAYDEYAPSIVCKRALFRDGSDRPEANRHRYGLALRGMNDIGHGGSLRGIRCRALATSVPSRERGATLWEIASQCRGQRRSRNPPTQVAQRLELRDAREILLPTI